MKQVKNNIKQIQEQMKPIQEHLSQIQEQVKPIQTYLSQIQEQMKLQMDICLDDKTLETIQEIHQEIEKYKQLYSNVQMADFSILNQKVLNLFYV